MIKILKNLLNFDKILSLWIKLIKSKLGTDGIVAVNTSGALASNNDTIREYRYSGNAKYCTYTIDDVEYRYDIDSDICPTLLKIRRRRMRMQ